MGNKASSLLARQVKAQRTKCKITSLHHPTSKRLLTNPQDIANAFSDYYSSLYKANDPTTPQPTDPLIQTFLSSIDLPTITPDQLHQLSKPFTNDEIIKAIKTLPTIKSPEEEGFVNEYFKQFNDILSPHLTTLFTFAASSGSFPLDMLRLIIITIPKPDKDPSSTANYRPISLLNTDVKLYAKVVASRLMPLLPILVHPDQVGFVPERQAPDATRRVINLIHQTNQTRTPSLLLSLDAEKAFDRVHWGFMKALISLNSAYRVGSKKQYSLSLYSNPSARVLTEGSLSKPFGISNGTRQGCPLSPIIFALLMEPLASKIQNDQCISGISCNGTDHKISLFVDDIILMVSNPDCSLQAIQETLHQFSSVSLYKLNSNKSLILPLNLSDEQESFKKEPLLYLGRPGYRLPRD